MRPIAPVEKFYDYLFKPSATHGKDHVFRALGYSQSDSQMLSDLYSLQADAKYAAQDYTLGKADEYGQRISIIIELSGQGEFSTQTSRLVSGWMIRADGTLTLNTPFSGFAR